MIELLVVDTPPANAVEQVTFIQEVGRVASFRLPPGGGVPETRSTPVLMVALTELAIDVGTPPQHTVHVQLEPGQAHYFPTGVSGLANTGDADIRFTLIDMAEAQ